MQCSPVLKSLSAQVRLSSGSLRPSDAFGSPAITCHWECRWFGCHQPFAQTFHNDPPKMTKMVLRWLIENLLYYYRYQSFGGSVSSVNLGVVTDPSAIICPAQVRVWRLLPTCRPSFAKPQAPQHLFPVTAGIAVAVQSKRRSIGCRKDLDNLLPIRRPWLGFVLGGRCRQFHFIGGMSCSLQHCA